MVYNNEPGPVSARLAASPKIDATAPDHALFIVVSFEGPDPYSQAGGLGVRVTGLAETLADMDYPTHLFFIGDPTLPGEESVGSGRLVLHRWSQWISANCPRGVYDGEFGKVADVSASMPLYLCDRILRPAVAAGQTPIILCEEWQTAECACQLSDLLFARGIRNRVVLAWNANNPYGFERIDWRRLASSATITTISRHMRSIIRACGADARVIPNGLPGDAFEAVPRAHIAQVRAVVADRPDIGLLFKMARWEREKGWTQALEAIARTRSHDVPRERTPVLIARSGGPSREGGGLEQEAHARGLRVQSFETEQSFVNGLADAVRAGADVLNLRFGVSPSLARTLYAASDGVLANSVSEPFGLVGLEAMAAGGVAFTGGTGEDYAVPGRNAVVLETLDPGEIVARWDELSASPELEARLRRAAKRSARDYEWSAVAGQLLETLTSHAP
jgi:glycosyltransferase involved in cell wall biosynthesis